MSHCSIKIVSNTLRTLLRDRMKAPSGIKSPMPVKIGTPAKQSEQSHINLFLYNIEENSHFKNQHIQKVMQPGSSGIPLLNLNLYYLVTAYGTTAGGNVPFADELLAQNLLGSCMQVFYEVPLINGDIETTYPQLVSDNGKILDPRLHGKIETIKINPYTLQLDDMAKIWASLSIPYQLSKAYQVSVAQVEEKINKS